MTEFCQTLFTMTAAATVAALAVMALRLFLKKVPRKLVCLLWLVVFFRMVCPVSFEAPVSLMPLAVTEGTLVQQVILPEPDPAPQAADPIQTEPVPPTESVPVDVSAAAFEVVIALVPLSHSVASPPSVMGAASVAPSSEPVAIISSSSMKAAVEPMFSS